MLKTATRTALATALCAFAFAPGGAKAADINLIMALPSPTLTFSAPFIAQDAGFYAKEGLKVEDRNLTGVASTNAVIAGSADFTVGTGATFVRAAANGQRLLAIGSLADKPLVELVLRKDVADAAGITEKSSLEDKLKAMKGKTIAVQGIGSIIHAMQRLTARRVKLDPDSDVRVTSMDPPQMLPAMMAKQIDGFATSLPFTTEAVYKGNAIMLASGPMADMPEYVPMDYVVLYTRPEVCAKERIKCEKMARALKAATQFIVDKPDEAYAILQKRFEKMDQGLLKAAWSVVSKAHNRSGLVTLKGLENSQKFSLDAGLLEPKDVLKDFKGLYTDEFMK
ncbi:MAG: ABC-type nitrate/sulfonate/bicarbonate transport system periplasmic component-like protein [Rhodospirillales bacterium]|nr:ABC-type nitrate/sulfonate/bicarbonate transport system periplasmic component-like protein [Rhodospirillales bacterium]